MSLGTSSPLVTALILFSIQSRPIFLIAVTASRYVSVSCGCKSCICRYVCQKITKCDAENILQYITLPERILVEDIWKISQFLSQQLMQDGSMFHSWYTLAQGFYYSTCDWSPKRRQPWNERYYFVEHSDNMWHFEVSCNLLSQASHSLHHFMAWKDNMWHFEVSCNLLSQASHSLHHFMAWKLTSTAECISRQQKAVKHMNVHKQDEIVHGWKKAYSNLQNLYVLTLKHQRHTACVVDSNKRWRILYYYLLNHSKKFRFNVTCTIIEVDTQVVH